MTNSIRKENLFGVFVAIVAIIVYANSLGNGFTLDDDSVILNNPVLKGRVLSLFSSIDTTGEAQLLPYYRPFTYLTFMFEGWLHGLNPFFVRLFNILLHAANSFLVYRLASILFKDNIVAALIAALLITVHPIQSEGVDFNAGGRNTMLACLLVLGAFLKHINCIEKKEVASVAIAAVLFTLGLFSKESALMLLPIILWIELRSMQQNNSNKSKTCLRVFPYFAGAAIYIVLRWLTLSKLGIQTSIIPGFGAKLLESMYITEPLTTRLFNNLYIIPRYFLNVIWPTTLASRYMIPDNLHNFALPLFGAWIFILAGVVWIFTKGRSFASIFGFVWLLLFWLPLSGIVIVPGSQIADRFMYIPAIGLWIIVADQFSGITSRCKPETRNFAFAGVALICIVLAGLTIRRNMDWKSNLTLYTRFVKQYPENVHARAGLGKVYYGEGKHQNTAMAEQEFEKTVALDANFPMIFTYLGNIKLNKEDLEGALYCYTKAIEVYPLDMEARVNRGITLEKLGRPKEAITDYLYLLSSTGNTGIPPGGREHAEKRIRELSH